MSDNSFDRAFLGSQDKHSDQHDQQASDKPPVLTGSKGQKLFEINATLIL